MSRQVGCEGLGRIFGHPRLGLLQQGDELQIGYFQAENKQRKNKEIKTDAFVMVKPGVTDLKLNILSVENCYSELKN